MKLLVYIIPFFLFLSCKKETQAPVLTELEYRIVNNGDPNLSSVVISTDLYLPGDGSRLGPSQSFINIRPFDTVILKVTDVTNSNKNFLNAQRRFELKVGYYSKIFSPLYFANGFIVAGAPYAIGWTYVQRFRQLVPDTVTSINKKIFYINWPSDTATLNEYY